MKLHNYIALALASIVLLSDVAFSQREVNPGGPRARIWPPAHVPRNAQEHLPEEFPGDTHGGRPRRKDSTTPERGTDERQLEEQDNTLIPMESNQ